jgi:hypothetical protein
MPLWDGCGKILTICKDNKRKPIIELNRTIPRPNANDKEFFLMKKNGVINFHQSARLQHYMG